MNDDMKGKNILITSGPTRADIDAVRFLSNRSSGRLGACIASEAMARGAGVTFVAGPGSRKPELGTRQVSETGGRLRILDIETVENLFCVLQSELDDDRKPRYDAIAHAMAVLDYQPLQPVKGKVKSGKKSWTLQLKKTPKIISSLREWSPDSLLIGFKLESDVSESKLVEAALALLRRSRAALVVANDIARIKGEKHPALFVDRGGNIVARAQTKEEIARRLCDLIASPEILNANDNC